MLNRSGPGLRSVLSRIVLATVAVVAVVAAGCDTDTPTAPTSLSNGTQAPEIRRVAIDDTLGAVSGYVFEDMNQNGMKDEGEPGLEGLIVMLADASSMTQADTTDADGEYEFIDARWHHEINHDPYYNANLLPTRADWVERPTRSGAPPIEARPNMLQRLLGRLRRGR